jgi:radical SAM superfamily enzyme YgiQ (UPF0313 family)
MSLQARAKPALLCVAPPYTTIEPPAGAAYLLAYARNQGCDDFGFLDLRLGVPGTYAPTYHHTGVFGESYVMDVPDLPLVLRLLANFDNGSGLLNDLSDCAEPYCRERGISPSYLEQYLASIDHYFSHVAGTFSGVRFFGFSTWTSNFLTTLLFAAHLKRLPEPPMILLGGPQVTESRSSAALALRSHLVDAVAIGEGEATLLDVYLDFRAKGLGRRDPLAGTAVLGIDGKVVYGPNRPLLQLGCVPVPTFDQMPLLSYQDTGHRSVPFHLSRGCTDRCVFCSEWKFWERFRPGEVSDTVAGIKKLKTDFGAEFITFTDSLLNGHPKRLREFAETAIREELDVSWDGFMRANMDLETAHLLKRAGCKNVFIGIESMSNETLALMKKRRTEENNVSALHAFLQAGIHVVAGVIPGFPKDNRDAFIHTSDRLRELQRSYPGMLRINAEPFVISPGQPMFSSLEQHNIRGIPWSEQVLSLAPRYRDITESIFCTVEGSNQGIERVGRLRIAEAMESDEPERMDSFDYKGEEEPEASSFNFEHLKADWYVARIKGPHAWIYAVIVTEAEKTTLNVEKPEDIWGEQAGAQEMRKILDTIARRHLVMPSNRPRLRSGGYFRGEPRPRAYILSPYVVARAAGSRLGHRIFVVDFFTLSWKLLPQLQSRIIQALDEGPQTGETIHAVLTQNGCALPLSKCRRILNDLAEEGLLLLADAENSDTARLPHSSLPNAAGDVPAIAAGGP